MVEISDEIGGGFAGWFLSAIALLWLPPRAVSAQQEPDLSRQNVGIPSEGRLERKREAAESEVPESRESEQPEETGVIASVELVCDIERCSDPVASEKLLKLAGLNAGRALNAQTLEIARSRLQKTGLFSEVEFEKRPRGGDSVALTVRAVGARRIRDVEVVGVDPPPFRSDLRKLLIFREGESYEGQLAKKNTQLKSLESEYEKEGYFGTDIEMIVDPVDGDEKLVDVVLKVDKGKSLKVCEIGVRGLEAMAYDRARRHLLSGTSFFARRLELVAPRYTTRAFEEGQKALVEAYRRLGYFQARIVETAVQKSFDEGCVTILVDLSEGPHWEVEFEGNTVFGRRELTEELPFYRSGYVDPEEIRRAERAIRQLYETRGYPFARVRAEEIRRDRLHRRLEFTIREGPRLEIEALEFHGNRAIGDATLAEGLGTRPFRVFESGGFLQTEELLNDLRRIEQAYRSKGYLRAVVERFELEVDRRRNELVVHIYLEEGTRTTAAGVRFDGVRSLSRGRIRNRVEVHADEAFVPVQVRADESRMVQLYSSVGYPLATVRTECRTIGGEKVPCERPKLPADCLVNSVETLESRCRWKSERRERRVCRRLAEKCSFRGGVGDSEQIRVAHFVEEGPLVTTGELLIQGNFKTRDAVIHRELPLESGDIFDVRKILQGQSNLRSLGIFNSVSIEAIGLDDAATRAREHTASLLVSVEESRNRFFEFNFGLEGRDLLGDRQKLLTTGEVQYSDRNLFGSALNLKPRIFGAADLIQVSDFGAAVLSPERDTRRVDYLLGAELALEHPLFLKCPLGIDKLQLTVTPFYLIDLLGVTNDQLLREEWGLALEVRKELSEVLDRFFVSLGLEGKQAATAPVDGPRVGGERIFSPRRVTGKLIPKFTLDRRDSPLNPSKGFFLRLQPELVTGDAFSPEIDTFDDSYLRLTWKGDFYIPIWEEVVLAQNLRYGQIIPLAGRQTRVPADERYFLGGAGSIRGYPNNSLGPLLNDQPSGGEFLLNYSFELRYPLLRGIDLRGATFFDTGLLVDCFSETDLPSRTSCYKDAFSGNVARNIRMAAGVGLRYVIADQIPLLFDYGIALDRQRNEGIGNLHFHLGYTF